MPLCICITPGCASCIIYNIKNHWLSHRICTYFAQFGHSRFDSEGDCSVRFDLVVVVMTFALVGHFPERYNDITVQILYNFVCVCVFYIICSNLGTMHWKMARKFRLWMSHEYVPMVQQRISRVCTKPVLEYVERLLQNFKGCGHAKRQTLTHHKLMVMQIIHRLHHP